MTEPLISREDKDKEKDKDKDKDIYMGGKPPAPKAHIYTEPPLLGKMDIRTDLAADERQGVSRRSP